MTNTTQASSVFENIFFGTAVLADQEEALKSPQTACMFAGLRLPGSDVTRLQEIACQDPEYAYKFARDIPGANIELCRKAASKDPGIEIWFNRYVK